MSRNACPWSGAVGCKTDFSLLRGQEGDLPSPAPIVTESLHGTDLNKPRGPTTSPRSRVRAGLKPAPTSVFADGAAP